MLPLTELNVQDRAGALWLEIDRRHRHNALNVQLLGEMAEVLRRAATDSSIGVIVITGAGPDAFCSGGDVGDLNESNKDRIRALMSRFMEVTQLIRHCPQPVIAAVNGIAVGGGNELVVACDLAIADPGARFGQVGPRIGSAPVLGGSNMLALDVGEKRAKEISMLCRLYTAQQALEMGWINCVSSPGGLAEEVDRWVAELLAMSPRYLEITKITSNIWWDSIQTGYNHGLGLLINAADSAEMKEGVTAFTEKRAPDFTAFRKRSHQDGKHGSDTSS